MILENTHIFTKKSKMSEKTCLCVILETRKLSLWIKLRHGSVEKFSEISTVSCWIY